MAGSTELDIRQRSLARAVYALTARRFTGRARAASDGRTVALGFDRGRVIAAKSSLPADALDQVAVAAKLVSPSQAEAARATGGDPLAALAEAAGLGDQQKQALARRALAQRAARLFSFEQGRLTIEETAPPRADAGAAPIDPRWLIARGVVTHYTEARLRRELSAVDGARLHLAEDAGPNLDALQLPATEAAVLDALRGSPATLDEITAGGGSDRRRTLAIIYVLLATDCLEVEAATATAAGGGAENSAAATSTLVAEKLRVLKAGADHFALLGLERGATDEEVRKAYFALAKKLHPDRLQAIGLAHEKNAQRVFAEVNQAFGVLSDPAKRVEYERAGGRDAGDQAALIVTAEEHARRGERLLKQSRFEAAAAELERAVELNPDEGEHHALAAWAQWSTAADKQAVLDEVVERFDKAAALAPKSATTHYYRGQIAKQAGDTATATERFRKVLELRPDHREAALELRLLERRAKQGTASGLFKKRKKS